MLAKGPHDGICKLGALTVGCKRGQFTTYTGCHLAVLAATGIIGMKGCTGLRPDYLVKDVPETGAPLAPFLRYVGTSVGRYGVSHTRPPTESRPGHVAMTSGFYEDPSALFSGWKANRVPFDSVFARVAAAWGFGSPDVVPIWQGHGTYRWQAYSAEMEDWSTNTNLFELDTWVFNRTAELLAGACRASLHSLVPAHARVAQPTHPQKQPTVVQKHREP